jgi:hypothetical protein
MAENEIRPKGWAACQKVPDRGALTTYAARPVAKREIAAVYGVPMSSIELVGWAPMDRTGFRYIVHQPGGVRILATVYIVGNDLKWRRVGKVEGVALAPEVVIIAPKQLGEAE